MSSRTDFWLYMHRLAAALDAEGVTPQERAENIIASFRQMPPIVRQEVLSDLRQLVRSLDEVEVRVIAAANALSQAESQAPHDQRSGNVA